MNVRGVEKGTVHRGDVVGHPDNPPTGAKEFLGQIIVINHPTAIAQGYTPVIHAHTSTMAATFTELVSKIDARTGQGIEEKPSFLKTGDSAVVKMRPLSPIVVEPFGSMPQLGRFAVRDMGNTIAVGVVKEVTEKA